MEKVSTSAVPKRELSALLYTLDAMLPFVDFHQLDWLPKTSTLKGWSLMGLLFFLIASGWMLGALLVGAVSGVLKRD
jgi:hypothetical protein